MEKINKENNAAFYKKRLVCEKTGLSQTTIWRMCKEGLFPLPRRLGKGRVGWVVEEVHQWISSRPTT